MRCASWSALAWAFCHLSCGGKAARTDDAAAGGMAGTSAVALPASAGVAPTGQVGGASPVDPPRLPEPPTCSGGPVMFEDSLVDASVRIALRVAATAPLQVTDVAELKTLAISEPGVASLGGLECLTGLEALQVSGGKFRGLTPISGLKHLRAIYFADGIVMDLAPLARLEQLDWLYLDSNQLEDMKPLAKLQRLYNLSLLGNRVRDVTPLLELRNLTELLLDGNPIDCADPTQHAALLELEERIVRGPRPPVPRDRMELRGFNSPCGAL